MKANFLIEIAKPSNFTIQTKRTQEQVKLLEIYRNE